MKKIINRVLCLLLTVVFACSFVITASAAGNANDFGESTVAVIRFGSSFDEYDSLEAAFEDSLPGDYIYLVKNVTITEDLTVPSNRTLVIPSSDDLNDTTAGHNVYGSPTDKSVYKTLAVTGTAKLTINGTLLVAGNQASLSPVTGVLTGGYGEMTVASTASVEVTNGGSLYARGQVSGEGHINADSGAKIYQLLQVVDYRGGTVTSRIYKNVFPFNCYNLTNITCPVTYEYGSEFLAQYYIAAKAPIFGNIVDRDGVVPVITYENAEHMNPNALFIMEDSTSSVDYSSSEVVLKGKIRNGVFSVVIPGVLDDYEITTDGKVTPIYNLNIRVSNGSTLTINQMFKFLPGSSLTVDNGGTVNLVNDVPMFFYTVDQYKTTFSCQGYKGRMVTAELTVNEGGSFNGKVGSSAEDMSNIHVGEPVASAETLSDVVLEIIQNGTSYTEEYVPFYMVELPLA